MDDQDRDQLDPWLHGPIEVIPAVDVLGDQVVRLRQGDYGDVVERADRRGRGAPAAGARRAPPVCISSISTAPGRDERAPSSSVPWPARARRCPFRPRAASARSRTRTPCSRPAPTGSSSAPPPGPTRRRGPRRSDRRSWSRVDVRDGGIRTAGWTKDGGLAAEEALRRARACGVARCLVTAIERDGTLAGPDLELVALAASLGPAVLAAGGIRSPADVAALAAAGAEAAIVGRALFGSATP